MPPPTQKQQPEVAGGDSPCTKRNSALMAAAHWLNDFATHAPIVFGGEPELEQKLKVALALPHCCRVQGSGVHAGEGRGDSSDTHSHTGKQSEETDDGDKCENCGNPATTFDSEGVPLCKTCAELPDVSLRRKDETGTMLVRRALEAASKLPTCQGCPDENLAVVVLAMDALNVVDTVEEVLRCYTVPVSSASTKPAATEKEQKTSSLGRGVETKTDEAR